MKTTGPLPYALTSDPVWLPLLESAYRHAKWSHDPSSQNGAVLVSRHPVRGYREESSGHNHIPGKAGPELEALLADRDAKYAHVVHAEVAAVADAARRGVATRGLTMVCPWAACLGCAGVILDAGITRLVVHEPRMALTHEPWTSRVHDSLAWLAAAGVEVLSYDRPCPAAPPVLVNGTRWTP